MYNEDDLEKLRGSEGEPEERGSYQKKQFLVSMAVSSGILIVISVLVASNFALAVSVAQVGGFQANIGAIEGADLQIYPGITQSSACQNTSSDFTPESGDKYLPSVKADVGSAKVPFGEPISVSKYIKTPEIFGIEAVKIGVSKSYGPNADVNNSTYSRSIGDTSFGEYIEEVNLSFSGNGNLNNPTGDNGGYADFTNINTFINKSEFTELTVTYNTSTNQYSDYVRAWIDWNQDGVFNDTLASNGGEAYNVGNSDGVSQTVVTNDTFIFVPGDAKPGPTMMRVSQRFGSSYPPPDDTDGDGETEDYTVIVDNPAKLGDASLSVTQFAADRIELNSIQADEEYSDGTNTNPAFGKSGGPYGEFFLGGQTATVRGVSGNAHFVSFADLSIPGVELELDYLDPTYQNDIDATQYNDADISGASPGENIVGVEWSGVEYEQSQTLSASDDGYDDYTSVETGNLSSAGTTVRVELSKPVGDELVMEWYQTFANVASGSGDLSTFFGHPSQNDDVQNTGNNGYTEEDIWSDGKVDTNGISWYNSNDGGDFSGWFSDTRPSFPSPVDPDLPDNGYSWRALGYIYAPESGTYTFGTDGDDGNDVVINGTALTFSTYDGDTDWTHDQSPESISLSKGYHEIKVRMQENDGGDNVKLGWQKPSDGSISTIPSRYFHTKRADTDLYVSAWVDWDQDGFLGDEPRNDLGRVNMLEQAPPGGIAERINVTGVVKPENRSRVKYGSTLMRIALREERPADYFENEATFGGEIEDYTVDVTPNVKDLGSQCLGIG